MILHPQCAQQRIVRGRVSIACTQAAWLPGRPASSHRKISISHTRLAGTFNMERAGSKTCASYCQTCLFPIASPGLLSCCGGLDAAKAADPQTDVGSAQGSAAGVQ